MKTKKAAAKATRTDPDEELNRWLNLPSTPQEHPERSEVITTTIPHEDALALKRMGDIKGMGCEDLLNHILREHYKADAFAKRLGAAIGDRVAEKLHRKQPTA